MGQVLAVVSGKGGTGKTSVCAAVAMALAAAGQKVLCIDADVGLRNLDISLGLMNEASISFSDVMAGFYPISRATVHPLNPNLHFLTSPVAAQPEDLNSEAFRLFLEQARNTYDWCFIDAPAGVGAGFRLAIRWADTVLVVCNPDPASLRDGAKTAETMEMFSKAQPKLIVNRIRRQFFKKLRFTVDDCMDTVGLPLLGIVPDDEAVPLAAGKGQPLYKIASGKKNAAEACRHIALRLMGQKVPLLKL